MNRARWFAAFFSAVAVVPLGAWWLQREKAKYWRKEIASLRNAQRELSGVRAEHERLAVQQVSADELAALRADRAAVRQLQSEIEKLRENLRTQEQALTQPAVSAPPLVPPDLMLRLDVGLNGSLALNGGSFDVAMLRQQLVLLPQGSRFEIRLVRPKYTQENFERIKTAIVKVMEAAKGVAQERDLKFTVRFE